MFVRVPVFRFPEVKSELLLRLLIFDSCEMIHRLNMWLFCILNVNSLNYLGGGVLITL
jgi:hypothetical protein